MEEETIFNNTNPVRSENNEPQPSPPPPTPIQEPLQPMQVPPPPPIEAVPAPSQVPPAPPPGLVDHGDGPPFKKILKIVGVIALISLILIVVIGVILPRFNKPKQENVTLTYWGLWEDSNIMKVAIDEFERENPKIKVDYQKQDIKEYRDKLSFRIPQGNGPDIFRYHNTWYPMISDILLPLPSEVISKEDFRSSYYGVASKDLIRNGAIYGIPLEVDTLSMFVNTSLIEEGAVPKSWQDFIQKSQDLTTRTDDGKIDISGAAIGTYENVSHAPDLISLLFSQNGVDLNNISKSEGKVNDALRFYTNFALVENNVWDQTLEPSLMYFSKGKVAMAFGYSWDLFTIKALNSELPVKIFPVPQLLQDESINMASYWVEGISSSSKHQKEALLFMKFLAKQDTQQKLYAEASKTRNFGEPFSNVALGESLADSPIYPSVLQAKTAVSSPFVDGTYDNGLNEKMNNYLKDTINSILSNTSVESATQTLFEGFNQVKGQYGG